jgi:DNA-binding transcriptional LysR family regulator
MGDGSDLTVTLPGRISVNAAEGMRTAVLAHLGLAVASERMLAPELANGTVQAVLTD